jgi:hypothetical protein
MTLLALFPPKGGKLVDENLRVASHKVTGSAHRWLCTQLRCGSGLVGGDWGASANVSIGTSAHV